MLTKRARYMNDIESLQVSGQTIVTNVVGFGSAVPNTSCPIDNFEMQKTCSQYSINDYLSHSPPVVIS